MVLPPRACKHDTSRTVKWIHDIFGTVIGHDLKMCPSVFGDDVMHIIRGKAYCKNLKTYIFQQLLARYVSYLAY